MILKDSATKHTGDMTSGGTTPQKIELNAAAVSEASNVVEYDTWADCIQRKVELAGLVNSRLESRVVVASEARGGALEGHAGEIREFSEALARLSPMYAAMDIRAKHLIPVTQSEISSLCDSLSAAQIDVLEEIHTQALRQISELKVRKARVMERDKVEEIVQIVYQKEHSQE